MKSKLIGVALALAIVLSFGLPVLADETVTEAETTRPSFVERLWDSRILPDRIWEWIESISDYLGIPVIEMLEQAYEGATLGEMATDQGLEIESLDEVVQEQRQERQEVLQQTMAERQENMAAQVQERLEAGEITEEQATQLLERIENGTLLRGRAVPGSGFFRGCRPDVKWAPFGRDTLPETDTEI